MSGFPAGELPRTAFNVRAFDFSAQSRGFPLQGIGPGSPKPGELHRKRGDSSVWDSDGPAARAAIGVAVLVRAAGTNDGARRYSARSISTMSECSCTRSNTTTLPSGATSKSPITMSRPNSGTTPSGYRGSLGPMAGPKLAPATQAARGSDLAGESPADLSPVRHCCPCFAPHSRARTAKCPQQ